MDNKDNKKKIVNSLIMLNNGVIIKCKNEDKQSILESNPGSSYIGTIPSY